MLRLKPANYASSEELAWSKANIPLGIAFFSFAGAWWQRGTQALYLHKYLLAASAACMLHRINYGRSYRAVT